MNYRKVVIIGITGSGKSSLASCLANKNVIISEGKGKLIKLVGPGIQTGVESFTTQPEIIEDLNSKILYLDCPGFDDTRRYKQEIINSFIIDYLFETSLKNKIKILLVVSASDFDAYRGQSITKTFEIIEEILNDKKLKIEDEDGLYFNIRKSENG